MSDAKNFKRGLQGVLQVPDPSKTSQRMASLYGSCFPHRAVSRANKHLLAGQSQPHENTHEKKKKKSTPLLFQRGKKKIINLQTEYWKFKYQTAETSWFINCTPYIFHKPIYRRNNKKTAVYNEFVVKVHTEFMWCSASFYLNWINFFS